MADIESNSGNWIKLNRKIWDNFIWNFETPQYAMAWIDMLLLANYKDKKILFDGKVKVIPRGSFITSLAKLSDRWGMNKRTVKRFLEILRDDGMITFQCTNKCTAVFISNYNAFQDFDSPECTAEYTADCTTEYTADCTAECTQHKKVKKIKESKESKNNLSISKDMDCSTDVQRTIIQAWNGLGLSKVIKIVPGSTRDKLLSKRLKDYGVDHVLGAIEMVRQSEFLNGDNKTGWRITFDWFIRPDNFAKVVGGNYDNNQVPPQPPPKRSAGGRKEMEPDWLTSKDRQQAFDDRMRRDIERLAEDERKYKTASDDP